MNFQREDGYPFIIAEIGSNHVGKLENIYNLITSAKQAGADAVKIQVYTPDELTLNLHKDEFIISKGPWAGDLYSLYDKNKIEFSWLKDIFAYAKQENIPLFASVFGEKSFLECEKYSCPAYKIANFESEHLELIKLVASSNKNIVISITDVRTAEHYKNIINIEKLYILYCNNTYPCMINKLGLSQIMLLQNSDYVLPQHVGFSDHGITDHSGMLAVAVGANILEKHICLDYKTETDDKSFSMTELSFIEYVRQCRITYNAIWGPPSNMDTYKRSIYSSKFINKGEKLTKENTTVIRPNKGMTPLRYNLVLGMKARYNIPLGTPITEGIIE